MTLIKLTELWILTLSAQLSGSMDRSVDHSCLSEAKNPETQSINANTDNYLSVKFYRDNVEIGDCTEKNRKTESL